MHGREIAALVLTVLIAATAAQAASTEPSYHVSKSVSLGAPDRWDYVVFDGGANKMPPSLKSGFCRFVCLQVMKARIAKQDCIKGRQDIIAVLLCPSNGVGVFELPVLRIGAVNNNSRDKRS